MVKKSLLIASLISGAAFVGCSSGPGLDTRVDELMTENDDLRRKNSDGDGKLAACRARCNALERELARRPKTAPKPNDKFADNLRRTGLDVRRDGMNTVIDIPSDLFFRSGSSVLSGSGERTLMNVANLLRREYRTGKIRVEGHTDTDPIRKTRKKYHCNFDLGYARAHTVAHVLINRGGIRPGRIICETYGQYDPKDPRLKSKNRRVQIVIAR